jgi:hypothetical protein
MVGCGGLWWAVVGCGGLRCVLNPGCSSVGVGCGGVNWLGRYGALTESRGRKDGDEQDERRG